MSISRIDQEDKHNHGYYVRVAHAGKIKAKFFADKQNGGKRAALRAAKAYEAQLIEERAHMKTPPRKISSRNTSGKTGVSRTAYVCRGYFYQYWQAAWMGEDGKPHSVKFSIDRFGEEKARRMAMKARRDALTAQAK